MAARPEEEGVSPAGCVATLQGGVPEPSPVPAGALRYTGSYGLGRRARAGVI